MQGKMSSSSSEDEMNEAFKESAECYYITRMVDAPKISKFAGPTGQNKPDGHDSDVRTEQRESARVDEEVDKFKETGFEKFLATRLASRLDEKIKIVQKKKRSLPLDVPSECGIRLFSDSAEVTELIENTCEPPVSRRSKPGAEAGKSIDYSGRAEEAAVSPQWVVDTANTKYWKDNKKPRVVSAKVLKTLSNGGLECVPLPP